MGETPNRAQLSPALAAEFENLQLIDLLTRKRAGRKTLTLSLY